ncbi:hypothetical protein BRD16_01700 [Halobacteriales archaeon SW_6_65_46]|nr:MAG: hypothetical protein BRD16_01700 [Halobacteriales archaeon SW_6_65_46]
MSSYRRSSLWQAFSNLNVVTAFAMILFAISGLIMTGLAGSIINVLETHQFAPLMVSVFALMVVFASSGTRDVRYYHPAETAFVGVTVVVMFAHAFLTQVSEFIISNNPISGAAVFVLLIATSAIVGR